MDRRRFLGGVTVCGVAALSGCSQIQSLIGGDSTRSFGESVEHRGLRVTPDDYTTANTLNIQMKNVGEKTAPSGATYLLTHLFVEHIGEGERMFPARGTHAARHQIIDMRYDENRLNRIEYEDSASGFATNGETYPNYLQKRFDGYAQPVYEGSVSGWLVNVIPEGFDPSNAIVSINWGATSSISPDEDNLETFTWTYSSE